MERLCTVSLKEVEVEPSWSVSTDPVWIPFIPWSILPRWNPKWVFSFFDFQSNYWLNLAALLWIHTQYFVWSLDILYLFVLTAHIQVLCVGLECPNYIIHLLKSSLYLQCNCSSSETVNLCHSYILPASNCAVQSQVTTQTQNSHEKWMYT